MPGLVRHSSPRPLFRNHRLAGGPPGLRLAVSAALAATILGRAGQAAASPLVVADRAVLWIVRPEVEPGRTDAGVRLIHARVGAWFSRPARFPLRRGTIYCAAAIDGRLHAFFGDGTYYTFRRTEARGRPAWAHAVQQLRLPGNFLPLAVGGDPADGDLWAIVPVHIALRIVRENERRDRLLAAAEEEAEAEPSTPPDRPAVAVDAAAGGYWLVKYAPRRWEPVEALPEFFGASGSAKLALGDKILALAWRPPGSTPDADLRYAQRSGRPWHGPETVPQSGTLRSVSLGLCRGEPVLVGLRPVPGDPAAARVAVLQRREGAWQAAELTEASGEVLVLPPDRTAAAQSGDRVIVAVAEDAETMRWGAWLLAGSGPAEDFRPVPGLLRPQRSILGGRWMQVASYLALALSLVTVFWRRRESLLKPAALPAGLGPAGFTRRAGGFLLDLLPALLLAVPFWLEPLRAFHDALIQFADEPEQIRPFLERLWVPSLLIRCFYAAYCLGWELWRGNTPGKMAVGGGLCTLAGRPCTRRQIVLRNLLRIIELEPLLMVWPLLLLLVITRNRQRLGDLWARTMVIQRVPVAPPPGPLEGRNG